MKKIALGGAVGLLLGLGVSLFHEPLLTKVKRLFLNSDKDNSPILIGDGSIHIKHKKGENHFVVNTEADQSVPIMTNNYFPVALGFLCDPTPAAVATACPANTNCNATPAAACTVTLPANTAWTLYLCQLDVNVACSASPDVAIAGNASSSTMSVTTTNGYFLYNPSIDNTGELVYSALRGSDHLGSPVLTLGGTNYTFACVKNAPCLVFDYQCTTLHGCQ